MHEAESGLMSVPLRSELVLVTLGALDLKPITVFESQSSLMVVQTKRVKLLR